MKIIGTCLLLPFLGMAAQAQQAEQQPDDSLSQTREIRCSAKQRNALCHRNRHTKRAEVLRKNGITLNPDFNRSVALMLHGSYHNADNQYGSTLYGVRQWNGYAQLMFETDFSPAHNFSADGQVNWDKV